MSARGVLQAVADRIAEPGLVVQLGHKLVQLAAQTFHARVIDVDDRGEVSALRKAAASLPRVARLRGRRRGGVRV